MAAIETGNAITHEAKHKFSGTNAPVAELKRVILSKEYTILRGFPLVSSYRDQGPKTAYSNNPTTNERMLDTRDDEHLELDTVSEGADCAVP